MIRQKIPPPNGGWAVSLLFFPLSPLVCSTGCKYVTAKCSEGSERKNKKRSRKNYYAIFFSGGLVSFHVEERDRERSRHNRNIICQLAGGFVFECSAVA